MPEPTPLSLEAGAYITKYVLDWLNTGPQKHCTITLEVAQKEPPAIMLQQLSGAVIKRKYIDGSYIGSYPFAVYVRTSGEDTAERIDAVSILNALNEWMKSEHPNIGPNKFVTNIFMTAMPSIAAIYDNGYQDYQAMFELEYRQGE